MVGKVTGPELPGAPDAAEDDDDEAVGPVGAVEFPAPLEDSSFSDFSDFRFATQTFCFLLTGDAGSLFAKRERFFVSWSMQSENELRQTKK